MAYRYKRNLDPWKNYEADDVWMAPREMQRAAYRATSTLLKVRPVAVQLARLVFAGSCQPA